MKTIEKRKGWIDNYKTGVMVQTVQDQEDKAPYMLIDGPVLKALGATWEDFINLPTIFKDMLPVDVQGGRELFPCVSITGLELLASRGNPEKAFPFSDWLVPIMLGRFGKKTAKV